MFARFAYVEDRPEEDAAGDASAASEEPEVARDEVIQKSSPEKVAPTAATSSFFASEPAPPPPDKSPTPGIKIAIFGIFNDIANLIYSSRDCIYRKLDESNNKPYIRFGVKGGDVLDLIIKWTSLKKKRIVTTN